MPFRRFFQRGESILSVIFGSNIGHDKMIQPLNNFAGQLRKMIQAEFLGFADPK
jgi:hypothetical protein